MTHPERAYTRAQLLDQVWGGNVYIEDRTIDVHIRRLRKVLEPFGVDRFVQTVRGTGYRFSTRADLVQVNQNLCMNPTPSPNRYVNKSFPATVVYGRLLNKIYDFYYFS